MALLPPIATPEDAIALGKGEIGIPALTVASIRVKTYLSGRASITTFTTPSEALLEAVCTIAARLQVLIPEMARGVQSTSSGDVNVSFGYQSFNGISDLVQGEKDNLDRIVPWEPVTFTIGL